MRRLPPLTALRFFEETARHHSFNRAADALCVTQSAVSRQILQLERTLKLPLFTRDRHGVRLTQDGQRLLQSVSAAFDTLETGLRRCGAASSEQRLVIAVPPTFASQWLTPRLGSLREHLPAITLSIQTGPEPQAHCRVHFERAQLLQQACTPLWTERHRLVAAPMHQGKPLTELLRTLPALHILHQQQRLDLWPRWLAQHQLPADASHCALEVSTLEQAILVAQQGLGLAIVDERMVASELACGALVTLSADVMHGPYGYWLELPTSHADLGHVQRFAAWLREQVAQHPQH